jgi:hypothetical protein
MKKVMFFLGCQWTYLWPRKIQKILSPSSFQLFLHQIIKGKSHFLLVILRWENSSSKEIDNDHVFQTLHPSENKTVVLTNNKRKSASPFLFSSPCKWETFLFTFEVHFFKIPTISKLDVHGWFFLGTIDSSYSLTKNCHTYLGWFSLKKELPLNITHNLSIFRIWKTILKFLKSDFFWKTGLNKIFKNEKVK